MSIVDDSHLTDEVIHKAFEGTNFGRTDFRTILAETVMKRAAGYHSGYTATTICSRLGLLGGQERPTKLGLTFAFHHYYKSCVRDALMPKLEARTLTVKLPSKKDAWHPAGYPEDSAYQRGYNEGLDDSEVAMETACAAAGITLVVGGE